MIVVAFITERVEMPGDTVDEEDNQFSQATAERLQVTGDALIDELRRHIQRGVSARGPAEIPEILDSTERVLALAAAFTEAHFDHLGTGAPIGDLEFDDDDDDDDDDDEPEEQVTGPGVSIVTRQDFIVTNEDAVVAASRCLPECLSWHAPGRRRGASSISGSSLVPID